MIKQKIYEPCLLCEGECIVGVFSQGQVTAVKTEPDYYTTCSLCGGTGLGKLKEIVMINEKTISPVLQKLKTKFRKQV